MEPSSLIDDAEFWLPPEFLTDEDFLLEKESNGGGIDGFNKCLFPYEPSHGFGPKADEDIFLTGMTRQMGHSTPEDDFSGGFFGNHTFPAGNYNKEWDTTRTTLCRAGIGCGNRNQPLNHNFQSRVCSQAAWDMYCAAMDELAKMNITDELDDYNSHSGRGGLLSRPRKHSFAAAENTNNGTGYYSHQSLPYRKLQAIQFQQLKQQQLMKHHSQLVQQSNKNGGRMGFSSSSSAWCNQLPRRDNSGMRAVFLRDHTGKRGPTGTGVFLPRRVNNNSCATAETREKHTLATVLVPARVAQVLNINLDESAVQPVVRSSGNLNDVSWKHRSNNGVFSSQMHGGVKAEHGVKEPRLPSEWAY